MDSAQISLVLVILLVLVLSLVLVLMHELVLSLVLVILLVLSLVLVYMHELVLVLWGNSAATYNVRQHLDGNKASLVSCYLGCNTTLLR